MNTVLKALALVALVAVSFGCAENSTETPRRSAEATYDGALTPLMKSLHDAESSEACYADKKEKMIEIARVLDTRRDEIAAFQQKLLAEQTEFPIIRLGPMTLIDNSSLLADNLADQWAQEARGWPDILETYAKIKDTPTDKSWRNFNRDVRGNILDDKWRILADSSYDVEREDGPMLEALFAKLDACAANACGELVLGSELSAWIARRPSMRKDLLALENYRGVNRAAVYNTLLERVRDNVSMFRFTGNKSMRIEGDTLVLPLRGDVFSAEDREKLGTFFAATWNRPDVKMRVDWVDVAAGIYRFVVESVTGGRAFVSHSKSEIHLYAYTSLSTYRHELGHVIGLPDEYYTNWDAANCRYVDTFNSARIMSENIGQVTPDNVARIRENY